MVVMVNGTRALTAGESADATGYTCKTIYRAIWDGKLLAVKSGRDYLITPENLQKYLDTYVNRHVELP
jgi:excisionase family DNA binding protein